MRLHRLVFTILLGCLFVAACDKQIEQGFKPVNPKATPEARQLLSFLYSLQGEYTLTGQHNFVSDLQRYDNVVFSITGKYPVVWGGDFSFMAQGDSVYKYQHCGPMNLTAPFDSCAFNGQSVTDLRQGLIDEVKRKYAEGRIITLMWHCCFPTGCDECDGADIWRLADRLPSQEEWDELVTDGTELNTLWKKQMDGVAAYLKQLRDANIPVLWRPFHEMNGVWFWWCNKPGENGFKKLWIAMYEYFTNHHELNNLLWVWNTNAPRDIPGDEAGPYEDFFPGVDYVDVLAADVYRNDWKQSHHDDLLKIGGGKLITLGEVGNVPTTELYETQPSWSWFMVWGYCIYNFANRENRESNPVAKATYDDPRSITLDKIDFSGNTYKLKKTE
ncbi:MAG: glycoside hydrolase family 26 protein [Tannerellaceae bacterium]|jgi:mannan endo-1,4-beta-mannosidase|nr:glycoside hydrolase family 26 protein [Tannerellaceae bacterium]